MRVLVIKTSSMGDLIHTLPALTDATRAIPDICFDWVSEEAFSEIPSWHPSVVNTIPVAIRRWRKNPVAAWRSGEIPSAIKSLKQQQYDAVIDAQGLIKSAIITRFTTGLRCGLDKQSCREPLAALAYQQRYPVSKNLHAIDRVRYLFAHILNYQFDKNSLDYGLDKSSFNNPQTSTEPYLVFLHGASRDPKLWAQSNWIELAKIAHNRGYKVYFPWGNQVEYLRAMSMCEESYGQVLPKMTLTEMAGFLAHATGVVGVDSGLAHLAAALGIPGVTLYVTTAPQLTGARGINSICLSNTSNIQSSALSVNNVWETLLTQIG